MDSTEELTVLSLCTGYGGIELGLERLGLRLRPVAYVERESFAAANLVAKIEAGQLAPAPVHSDVKTFPYERFRGLVDIMLAGYPCQPFSGAGQRQGSADPRHLWPHIADGIAACRPGLVFAENVEGHVAIGLRDVLCDLGRMGYRTTFGLFDAASEGASHQRKRVFILADSEGHRCQGPFNVQGEANCGGNNGSRQGTTAGMGIDGQRWPAGPGQPQHEWEEPRTVVTQLDGATDGCASGVDATANWVDRLRLLGNGVVPATAAKAYATLSACLTK